MLQYLDRLGVSSADVARDAGITVTFPAGPDARIPGSQVERLWSIAIDRTRDPLIGMHMAEAYSPGALMLENVIEWCYAPGVNVRRIEFYGKVSEAHQPWLTETRAMSIASVYRYEWLAKLRAAAKRKAATLTAAPIQPIAS